MPFRRQEFATDDVQVALGAMTAAYGSRIAVSTVPGVRFELERTAATDGTLTVSTLRLAGRASATSFDGFDDVTLIDILGGRYSWRSAGRDGDERRALLVPPRQEMSLEMADVRSVVLVIDADVATRWLARYGGLPPAPPLLPRITAGSDAVRQAIRFAGALLPSAAIESDLVRANLVDLLLSVTAHQLVGETVVPVEPSSAAPATLRRAEEHLRAHAAEPLLIADVATAAGTSIRGLQDQFRRWLHVTPAQYLRNVRLDGVRAELVAARVEARPVRVADVARRWGFGHLGRFSAQYAEAFGESPSRTLRVSTDDLGAPPPAR